jgi:hypothetical protein
VLRIERDGDEALARDRFGDNRAAERTPAGINGLTGA